MVLLVAYKDDPAGYNMAHYLAEDMAYDDDDHNNNNNNNNDTAQVFRGKHYDIAIIDTPAISADWLESAYDHDSFVFLSKHAAQSGRLALTCHSTGNFSDAQFGGSPSQVSIPMPDFQKAYLQELKRHQENFADFQITIEATHHGPTALNKPCIFVEVGTTSEQWNNKNLCSAVSKIVDSVLSSPICRHPTAIAFGGTHYHDKFTDELLYGVHALGTVVPKHALQYIDDTLFSHIISRNSTAGTALVDSKSLGASKQKILNLLSGTDLEVIKL